MSSYQQRNSDYKEKDSLITILSYKGIPYIFKHDLYIQMGTGLNIM